jgi:hypothetical protein
MGLMIGEIPTLMEVIFSLGVVLEKRLAVYIYCGCAKGHRNEAQVPAISYEVDESDEDERWRDHFLTRGSNTEFLKLRPGLCHSLESTVAYGRSAEPIKV